MSEWYVTHTEMAFLLTKGIERIEPQHRSAIKPFILISATFISEHLKVVSTCNALQ